VARPAQRDRDGDARQRPRDRPRSRTLDAGIRDARLDKGAADSRDPRRAVGNGQDASATRVK